MVGASAWAAGRTSTVEVQPAAQASASAMVKKRDAIRNNIGFLGSGLNAKAYAG